MAEGKGPDLEGLKAFVKREERQWTPFFVGRGDIIAAVEDRCREAVRECSVKGGCLEGATRLVQGAPGAGKTALLSEMKRRWCAAANERGALDRLLDRLVRGKGIPVAVDVRFDELEDEGTVAKAIADAVFPGSERVWRTTDVGERSVRGGLPGIVSASWVQRHSVAPAVPSFRELRRRFPPGKWRRPVCLMVDEIQHARPEARAVLVALHQGMAGLPIVPVLAGLGNSYDVLQRLGLSRLADEAIHDIGRLAPKEACEAVQLMLEKYRVIRGGGDYGWGARLANYADCWPIHLHNGMRELARGLREVDGRLADVDVQGVANREWRMRMTDYWWRMSPEMREAPCLVDAVLDTIRKDGGAHHADIIAAIEYFSRPGPDGNVTPECRIPDGMSAVSFLDHLVHWGILQLESDIPGVPARYVCLVPSFVRLESNRPSPGTSLYL